MQEKTVARIAERILGSAGPVSGVCQIRRSEDGSPSGAWRVETADRCYFLKKIASPAEEALYTALAGTRPELPAFFGGTDYYGKRYILSEYFPGRELSKCARRDMILALDALISLQDAFWQGDRTGDGPLFPFGMTPEGEKERIRTRRAYLHDPLLEAATDKLLALYDPLPRTLCHNDLLPFNVLAGENRAVLIDWEYYGLLPYPVPLARLLSHTRPDPDWDFTMTAEDRTFAEEYYYDRLLKGKGIGWEEYRYALDLFSFYEQTEWIYVCRRYHARQPKRFAMGMAEAVPIAEKWIDRT